MSALTLLRTSNALLGRFAPAYAANRARTLFTTPRRSPRRPWEATVEAAAERDRLQTGASYLRWRGGARRVLCMHGWEGRATQFGALAARLREAEDFDVISLDGPAHGDSPGLHASPVHFAQAILLADRELGPFYGIVGHSMGGGAVAVALAWGLRTERAVTIAAPSSLPGVLKRFADFVGLPVGPARESFVSNMVAFTGFQPAELELDQLAEDFKVPGLVIHDRNDGEVPFSDGEALVARWPQAELMAVDGPGHRRILRDPEVVNRIVDFMRS